MAHALAPAAPAQGAPALGAPALGAPAPGAPALGAPAPGAPALGAPAPGAPCVRYRSEASAGGYPLLVLKSALQKYIRWNRPIPALQVAKQFHTFADSPEADKVQGIRTNYVRRLCVIAVEDVGDYRFLAAAMPLISQIAERPFGDETTRLLETAFICNACAWPKSRAGSHGKAVASYPETAAAVDCARMDLPGFLALACLYQPFYNDSRRLAPEEWVAAFERELAAGSAAALLWGWHIANSDRPFPPAPPAEKFYPRRRKGIWVAMRAVRKACAARGLGGRAEITAWYLEQITPRPEQHLCWILPVLSLLGLDPAYPAAGGCAPALTPGDLDAIRTGALVIDGAVLDQHTGHRAPDADKVFALIGSAVTPEVPPASALFREFYLARKGAGPAQLDSECGRYALILRAQLVTGVGKTDTYFAWPRVRAPGDPAGGEVVVVKGPFDRGPAGRPGAPQVDFIKQVLAAHRVKQALGLIPPGRGFRLRVEELLPDRWPEGTPLGRRNALPRAAPQFFLVASSWIPEKELTATLRDSKLWPPTVVAAWEGPMAKYVFDPGKRWDAYPDAVRRQYVLLLCFRHAVGVGDHADRNFLLVGEPPALVSFDEEPSVPAVPLLRGARARRAAAWVAANLAETQAFLGRLVAAIEDPALGWGPETAAAGRARALLRAPHAIFA